MAQVNALSTRIQKVERDVQALVDAPLLAQRQTFPPQVDLIDLHADNFGAASYANNGVEHLLSLAGAPQPCSTFAEAAEFISAVTSGDNTVIAPPRFAPSTGFTVIQARSSATVTLSNANGFNDADVLIIACPMQSANRGAFVLARDPNDPNDLRLIAYVKNPKDAEQTGSSIAVLAGRLAIASPQRVAGTSATIASAMIELGCIPVGPRGLIAGAMGNADRSASQQKVLSYEPQAVSGFTYNMPREDVIINNPMDPLNLAVFNSPTGLTTSRGSRPQQVGNVTITAGGPAAVDYQATGFVPNYTGALVTPMNLGLQWSLSNHADFFRYLFFGDFKLSTSINTNGTTTMSIRIQVEHFEPGGLFSTFTYDLPPLLRSNEITLDTRALVAYPRGKLVRNILVSISSMAGTQTMNTGANSGTSISCDFFDVKANTVYLTAVISGASTGTLIGLSVTSHCEAFVSQIAEGSKFITLSQSLPAGRPLYDLLYALELLNVSSPTAGAHTAAGFASRMAKFARRAVPIVRRAGRVGNMIVPGNPVSSAIKYATQFQSASFDISACDEVEPRVQPESRPTQPQNSQAVQIADTLEFETIDELRETLRSLVVAENEEIAENSNNGRTIVASFGTPFDDQTPHYASDFTGPSIASRANPRKASAIPLPYESMIVKQVLDVGQQMVYHTHKTKTSQVRATIYLYDTVGISAVQNAYERVSRGMGSFMGGTTTQPVTSVAYDITRDTSTYSTEARAAYRAYLLCKFGENHAPTHVADGYRSDVVISMQARARFATAFPDINDALFPTAELPFPIYFPAVNADAGSVRVYPVRAVTASDPCEYDFVLPGKIPTVRFGEGMSNVTGKSVGFASIIALLLSLGVPLEIDSADAFTGEVRNVQFTHDSLQPETYMTCAFDLLPIDHADLKRAGCALLGLNLRGYGADGLMGLFATSDTAFLGYPAKVEYKTAIDGYPQPPLRISLPVDNRA